MANQELIPRRAVIEEYVRYDARKKKLVVPADMADWDWSSADDLDRRLRSAKFKPGIIAGYTDWKRVELAYRELANCAICNGIFPGVTRVLGQLTLSGLENWKPDRDVEWFEPLERGPDYPTEWPMILRPAVKSESPAMWYVEDGSGRAICFFRRLVRTADYTSRAFGYLGIAPDANSTFMKDNFRGLL